MLDAIFLHPVKWDRNSIGWDRAGGGSINAIGWELVNQASHAPLTAHATLSLILKYMGP